MAEARFSKMSPAEIYAIATADMHVEAFRRYAADLKAQAMSNATPVQATPAQKLFMDAAKILPANLQPYAPAIFISAGAAALILLLGRR